MNNNIKTKNSTINGDVFIGDKHYQQPELLPLQNAIKAIQSSIKENPELEEIIEELAEYTTDHPNREIIGVEKKLINGNRKDLLEDAVYLKNKFERLLAKKQMSLVEQRIYAHVLAVIDTSFKHKIRPLILEKKPTSEIDSAILSHIIEPVYKSVVEFNSTITQSHVAGMLYFLTGKCHLVWDN